MQSSRKIKQMHRILNMFRSVSLTGKLTMMLVGSSILAYPVNALTHNM